MSAFNSIEYDALYCDQDYVIKSARKDKSNIAISKAWLLTGKTIFPDDLGIQFEDYDLEKSLLNTKEASKCFTCMFNSFSDNPMIWKEITTITNALRAEVPTYDQMFLNDMFTYLTPDVQHKVLLLTAERTQHTIEHCRLMLLLLRKFPNSTNDYWERLVDLLTDAETNGCDDDPVNQYRKILVTDLTPLLVPVDIPSSMLFLLLHKTVEFYICFISHDPKVFERLPESESVIKNPWACLFEIFHAIGVKLGWSLSAAFVHPWNKESACQKITQFVNTHATRLSSDSKVSNTTSEIVYCTFLLFLNALDDYNNILRGGDMVMIEVPIDSLKNNNITEPPTSKKKCRTKVGTNTEDETVFLTSVQNNSAVRTFKVGQKCFELFQTSDILEKEFYKLIQKFKLEKWVRSIFQDIFLIKGRYDECIDKVQNAEPGLSRSLKVVCASFCKMQYLFMMENIKTIVEQLSPESSLPSEGPIVPLQTPTDYTKRHLHFLPLKKRAILQYISKLLIVALKKMEHKRGHLESDMALGHTLVLIQLDWPHDKQLFTEIIARIKQNRRFTYHMFMKYIVCIDFLEEFMSLSNERAGVALDILVPTTSQLLSQRRMSTRGVDKGAKEDFKMAMRRQTGRSSECIENVIMQFITNEKDAIGHCLMKPVNEA